MKKLFFLSLLCLIACKQSADIKKDGGMRFLLEADNALTKEIQTKCITVLTSRLKVMGVEGASIREGQDAKQLIVEFAGKQDLKRIRKIMQQCGKLCFYETFDNKELFPKFEALNKALAKKSQTDYILTTVTVKKKKPSGNSLLDSMNTETPQQKSAKLLVKENPLFAYLSPAIRKDERGNSFLQDGPVIGYASIKDTALLNAYFKDSIALYIVGPYKKFLWAFKSISEQEFVFELIALRLNRAGQAQLRGDMIQEAKKMSGKNNGGRPEINITMTPEAAFSWRSMTHDNIGKAIAIVLDDQIVSFPIVQSEIEGGRSTITGNFSEEEADDLVSVLKSGGMPAALHVIKEEEIPPMK